MGPCCDRLGTSRQGREQRASEQCRTGNGSGGSQTDEHCQINHSSMLPAGFQPNLPSLAVHAAHICLNLLQPLNVLWWGEMNNC